MTSIVERAVKAQQRPCAMPEKVLTFDCDVWMVCGCGERIDLEVDGSRIPEGQISARYAAHVAAVNRSKGDAIDG